MPDFTPPVPGLPQPFLDSIRNCTYDASTATLRDRTGATTQPCLADAGSTVAWVINEPSALPMFKLSAETFRLLSKGELQANGGVYYMGTAYRLSCVRHTDGSLWAEPVKA
jgi:hypothetical protein